MKENLKLCFHFFWRCFIMGAVGFGGGYGMIPMMEKEFVEKRKYVTREEMVDILAISQSIPGLISVNTVIMIGCRRKNAVLALFGVVGLVIPSLVILCLVALAYSKIITNRYAAAVFTGVRAGVIALLVNAIVKLIKSAVKDIWTLLMLIISAVLLILRETNILPWLNPIYIILFAAAMGLLIKYTGHGGTPHNNQNNKTEKNKPDNNENESKKNKDGAAGYLALNDGKGAD